MLNMLIYYLGFLDSYNEVQDKLVAEVKAQLDRHPGYKIVVTG